MRVALVVHHTSYRVGAFLDAAHRLGVECVVVTDHRPTLQSDGVVHVDDVRDVGQIDAVVAAEDWGVVRAATLARALGLPGNAVASAFATLDKRLLRAALIRAGLRQPASPGPPPWIVKPVDRSGGEGVHLVHDTAALAGVSAHLRERYGSEPLVEEFIPGPEVIIEGILVDGVLHVVASFDKPGARDGPWFPETMLVGPSVYELAVVPTAAAACRAVGLVHGPVHIEIVVSQAGPAVLEVHARSIGGRCSAAVPTAPPLEDLILRGALGWPVEFERHLGSSGVFMLPVEQSGRVVGVDGIDDARGVVGITGLEITALGQDVVPLPERGGYLGFVFAAGNSNAEVQAALSTAASRLTTRYA